MRLKTLTLATSAILALCLALPSTAQMPKSPKGSSATQVGADFSKWITVDYSRPILRGRTDIFGSGNSYGEKVKAGAPEWRAGADVTTRLKTEAALKFGDKMIPAGEYSLFIRLASPTEWTLLISTQPAMQAFDRSKVGAETWGAYGFDEKLLIAKVPMTVAPLEMVMDQLTWVFTDVSATGGTLAIAWDKTVATVPFTVQ